jgi:hypothetical protein
LATDLDTVQQIQKTANVLAKLNLLTFSGQESKRLKQPLEFHSGGEAPTMVGSPAKFNSFPESANMQFTPVAAFGFLGSNPGAIAVQDSHRLSNDDERL